MEIRLDDEQASVVSRVLAECVQKIDYELGDCNNEQLRKELRANRALLVAAIGEIEVGRAV